MDRLPVVAEFVVRALPRTGTWGLMWPCILGSLILLRGDSLPLEAKCWRALVAVMACSYLTILVVTPLHLEYPLKTTFSRLTLHLFPLAMLIMAEQVAAAERGDDGRTARLSLSK